MADVILRRRHGPIRVSTCEAIEHVESHPTEKSILQIRPEGHSPDSNMVSSVTGVSLPELALMLAMVREGIAEEGKDETKAVVSLGVWSTDSILSFSLLARLPDGQTVQTGFAPDLETPGISTYRSTENRIYSSISKDK
jgi:hypothetical protein